MSDEALLKELPLVRRIAGRTSRHCPALADETLSDALFEALKLARGHDPERSKLSTHLRRHLPLRMIDRLRFATGRRGRRRVEAGPLDPDAAELAQGHDQCLDQEDAIEALLRPLAPRRRRVLWAWCHGEGVASIARRMGVVSSRVSQILKESLEELREAHRAKS